MISFIRITNFQKHRCLELDLNQVTTIKGQTDSGKSAILRALMWVATNRPSGDEFIRKGAKQVRVEIILDGAVGRKIIRVKGSGENYYQIADKKFEAFGTDVPEEVSNVLKIADTNYQGQHASPFWFCETAGEVSRQLNSIVDLGVIDTTMSNLAAKQRRETAKREVIVERVNSFSAQVQKALSARDMDADLKRLEHLQRTAEKTRLTWRRIADLAQKGYEYDTQSQNAADIVTLGDKLKRIAGEVGQLEKKIKRLSDVIEQGQSVCERATKWGERLAQAQKERDNLKVCPRWEKCPLKS